VAARHLRKSPKKTIFFFKNDNLTPGTQTSPQPIDPLKPFSFKAIGVYARTLPGLRQRIGIESSSKNEVQKTKNRRKKAKLKENGRYRIVDIFVHLKKIIEKPLNSEPIHRVLIVFSSPNLRASGKNRHAFSAGYLMLIRDVQLNHSRVCSPLTAPALSV
jgi:hypothetical protein